MRRSSKIYYDINESDIYLDLCNARFYFSSSFNKDRFLQGYMKFIKEEEDKIIAKYKVKISIRFYLLISYYIRIEKRGFLIKKYGEKNNDYDIILSKDRISFTEIEV